MQQQVISEERNIVTTKTGYYDKWLWCIGYPVLAISMIFIANDNSFVALFKIPSFYTDLLFAFSVTFLAGLYIKRITVLLDTKYPWHERVKKRIALQFVYGVVIPVTISMFMEIVYLYLIDIPIRESSVFYLELPLSFLFLLLANLFYVVHYLFYSEHTRTIIITSSKPTIPLPDFLTVLVGFTEKKIAFSNCAVIISREKLLWLYTFDGEQYRLTGTMDEWEEKFRRINIFRLNRQVLAVPGAIRSIEQTSTRKVLVRLSVLVQDEIYVSKEKAAVFQNWWRNSGTLQQQ
jgi:LytTr DNA-binding domain